MLPPRAVPATGDNFGFLVYDSDRNLELLLVPGLSSASVKGDPTGTGVWEWDGSSWAHRSTPNAPAYVNQWSSAAYDPDLHETILMDGVKMPTDPPGATWLFDGTGWSAQATSYTGPLLTDLSYDPLHHAVVALDTTFNTWRFDGKDWHEVTPAGDAGPVVTSGMGRQGPAVTFDPVDGQWVLFGGTPGSGGLADTWTSDQSTWTLRAPARSPSPRAGFPGARWMTWDPALSAAVLYGGTIQYPVTSDFGDTWAWDGNSWTQLAGRYYPPPSPTPQTSPVSAARMST